ncbi:MAG: hypothetical protein IT379_09780 [Deltaproteobacteria bacterium]|nr:hypothetical protein [Deltaproteobacteria bacterium]
MERTKPRTWRCAASVVLCVASLGCGDDDGRTMADASVPDAPSDADLGPADGDAAIERPTAEPPAAPDPVAMTPCPMGWREVRDPALPGEVVCDPWPLEGRSTCEDGQAHFPGEPGCTAISRACADDGWPADLPADGTIVFVRADAAGGGDGSRDRPLTSVGAALGRVTAPAIVAVGAGSYDEAITVPAGVEVRGACAARTTLAPTAPSAMSPVVLLRGRAPVLRDVSVTGERPGVVAAETVGAVVEGVRIHEAMGAGFVAAGAAEATLTSVAIQRTRRGSSSSAPGRGMEIGTASIVEARGLIVESSLEAGVVVAQGASATLERAAVIDTLADRDGTAGNAISVFDGGAVELSASVVERARTYAIAMNGSASRATLRDVVIRDVLPQERDGFGGLGIQVVRGARLEGSRVLVERVRHFGIFVADPGSDIAMGQLAIRTVATIETSGELGWGIAAIGGATLGLDGLSIVGAHDIALLVASGAQAQLSSVTVRGTRGGHADMGRAIAVQSGASATVSRVLLEGNRENAFFVAAATVEASDVAIRDTASSEGGGVAGRGIEAQSGASVVLRRVALVGNREVGLLAVGEATSIEASDLDVERTQAQACASSTCASRAGGFGLAVVGGARLVASAFRVASNDLAGLVLAGGGVADLSLGTIADNPIGVSVRTDGFDLERVMDGVFYDRNERTFDATELPVPEAAPPSVEPE